MLIVLLVIFLIIIITVLCLIQKKITSEIRAGGTKDIEIMVSSKCLINFWRTLEMSSTNFEINFILTWSEKCMLSNCGNRATTFAITDTKFYVIVVTLSTQDNAKLLQQFKSVFKRTINWNKYQSKVTIETLDAYLDYLVDPSFQGVNRRFVLSLENNDNW